MIPSSQASEYPRPGFLIHRVKRLFERENERRLAPRKVHFGQIPVIVSLGSSGRQTQTQLAKFACVEQPTMANLLDRMERDGLIERIPDPTDRRSSLVTLAPDGEAAFPVVIQVLEEVNDHAYSGFSKDERLLFTSMLRRMISNLEALGDE